MFSTLMQDVRFALRQLRKTPGFTATAILTLALGIGANAAIFTLVNAVLLRNLPVVDPATLVHIGDNNDCCVGSGTPRDDDFALFDTNTYEQIKKNVPEFEELAAMQAGFGYRPVTVRRDRAQELARSVMGEFVSGNYFDTFGLKPYSGRLITNSDDAAGAPVVAVMSYQTWQHDYAGDPSVVGSTFWVNTKAVTIAGIAPKGFYGDRLMTTPPDFYFPIEGMPVLASVPYVHNPGSRWLYIVGRIKPGVQMGPLNDKINALLRQSVADTRAYSKDKDRLAKVHTVLTPGGSGIQHMQEQYASNLKMLMMISGIVLLIACANIANLLLARGMARKVEMSVRTALGASRMRVARQLLTESIVLAILSGIAGLAVAYAGTHMLLALAFPDSTAVPIDANPSLPVLGFAFLLSVVTGVLFGVAPAWIASQAEAADALRSGSRTTTSGATLLQRGLVVLQAALSLVLLVGAGLFSQSLRRLEHTDLKLDSRNRYIVHINPQAAGYSVTQMEAFQQTLVERFHALPGVVNVGISSYTPMEDDNWGTGIQLQGKPSLQSDASIVRVSPEYFDSVGTRVVMGRSINRNDTPSSPTVAVVNQAFVRKMFDANENPIGRHFGGDVESAGDYEIVGVVEDTPYQAVQWKDHRMYFIAPVQRPPSAAKEPIEQDQSLYPGAIVIQTDRPISNMAALTQRTLASINPNLTIVRFDTFDEQIAAQFNNDRLLARLTMLFGMLALLLATVGLYGVTAYSVARRTSEIGIRMALGAERGSVVAMVMRGAMTQTVLGLAIGVPIAFLCVRYIKAQLYEASGIDLSVLLLAITTLIVATSLAGMIPARKAASTDPAKALRTE